MSMTLKRDHHRPRFENDKVDIMCICIYIYIHVNFFCTQNTHTQLDSLVLTSFAILHFLVQPQR